MGRTASRRDRSRRRRAGFGRAGSHRAECPLREVESGCLAAGGSRVGLFAATGGRAPRWPRKRQLGPCAGRVPDGGTPRRQPRDGASTPFRRSNGQTARLDLGRRPTRSTRLPRRPFWRARRPRVTRRALAPANAVDSTPAAPSLAGTAPSRRPTRSTRLRRPGSRAVGARASANANDSTPPPPPPRLRPIVATAVPVAPRWPPIPA